MGKPCNDCPFMKSSKLEGSPEWLKDIWERHQADQYFDHSCHKTDPQADGFAGGKRKRECKGHIRMMMNKSDNTPGRVFTRVEIMRLLKACENDLRTKAGIMLGVFMGLRKMEALELKRTSIYKDFDEKCVEFKALKVWSKKNGAFRHIRIPGNVLLVLDAWLKTHDSPWVFPQKSDIAHHMASQVFDQGWRRAKVKAEIRGAEDFMAARFHDLRHTFATMTAREGWPPAIACEVLDMTIKVYMGTYVHIDPRDMAKWMRGVSFDTY